MRELGFKVFIKGPEDAVYGLWDTFESTWDAINKVRNAGFSADHSGFIEVYYPTIQTRERMILEYDPEFCSLNPPGWR